jgi:hypothetical protein
MTEIRLVGEMVAPDRLLYVTAFSGVDKWPRTFDEPARPFIVFTALDATLLTDEELRRFARALIDQGCVCSCSWGTDADRVEKAFDLAADDAEKAGGPSSADFWSTAWEDESLDDALWYAVFTTAAEDGVVGALLAVAEDTRLGEIEARLSDSMRWSARLLDQEAEDGK